MKKKMIKYCLLSVVFLCGSAFGNNLSYNESTGSKTGVRKITITPVDKGYLMNVEANGDVMEYQTDQALSIVTWKYKNESQKTNMVFTRSGETITADGEFKGKKFQKQIKIDAGPWYQEWGASLKNFITSDEKTVTFWSINATDVSKISKFKAVKKGEETVEVNGKKVEGAVHVVVSLPGFMEILWHADHWFRKTDGREILNKTVREQGAPLTTSELAEEQQ